jgi:hypothetical protein
MSPDAPARRRLSRTSILVAGAFAAGLVGGAVLTLAILGYSEGATVDPESKSGPLTYRRRKQLDPSGFSTVLDNLKPWSPDSSLPEIAEAWRRIGYRQLAVVDDLLGKRLVPERDRVMARLSRSMLLNYEGEPRRAYDALQELRTWLRDSPKLEHDWHYTIAYFQGVTALRLGENENCIMCRGESSCILPISPSAVHQNPRGSRLAIRHFTEYLDRFGDDLGVRWLLNLAHMTLGEYPEQVDPRYRIPLDHYANSEFDIGRFRDIGHRVGVDRYNQAGGAIMDDFDNDGLLDLAVTTFEPLGSMSFYRNRGDGTFEDRTAAAGVSDQLGGLYCVQADYDNDGNLDIFIPRGAWLPSAIRPTLLRNDGGGTFRDVTEASGLMDPVNSNSACWADYDNDGWLDLFVCCELQANRLYRNRGNGTFEEVAEQAGLPRYDKAYTKGATWFDFDNDRYPDLFVSNLMGASRLYHNRRDGTFEDVSLSMAIDGLEAGFSCWSWDYDNDGWLDLFATCYDRSLEDIVRGLIGEPHGRQSNRLYRNLEGRGFEDRTREAGLDMVFATMGSNYGDFDNDGFLDMYLATGDPSLATLVPNRMFKGVAGRRFAEITGTAGTGNLQKGHGVACGDWDRDGDVDIFVEMGGAINGDRYHNILFANPGQGNHSLTVKLIGRKTNRAAIGARIKVVTAGEAPLVVQRHVSSGSSFGANPLEQTIGLAGADTVAVLEVTWPTSDTTQVFRDIPADAVVEITEFAGDYKRLTPPPIPTPDDPDPSPAPGRSLARGAAR